MFFHNDHGLFFISLWIRFFLLILPQSWTHNISKEKEFLRKLVKANVITDLTNGIWVYTHPQSPSAFPQGLLNRKRGKGSTLRERTFRIRVACTLPGLSYQRRLFKKKKKDTGEFLWRVAHMCLLNQRLLLKQGGRWGGIGRTESARFLSYQETAVVKLCRSYAWTFTTSSTPPHPHSQVSHEW